MPVNGETRSLPRPWRPRGAGEPALRDRLHVPLGNEIWADEFDDGSIDAGWTRTDASSSSYVVWKEGGNPGVMSAFHTSSATASGYWHALSYALPGGATHPLTVEAYITGMVNRNTQYMMSGLAFTDGTGTSGTNQAVFMPFAHASNDSSWAMSLRDFNNWNSQVSNWDEGNWGSIYAGFYGRIQYTAANTFRMCWSSDGISWVYGGSRTCTFTPAYVSLINTNWGGATPYVTSWNYIRLYDTLTPEGGDTL